MNDTTREATKRQRRPQEAGTPIMVRLQRLQLEALDKWVAGQNDSPSRPEAIRRLLSDPISGPHLHEAVGRLGRTLEALERDQQRKVALADQPVLQQAIQSHITHIKQVYSEIADIIDSQGTLYRPKA